MLPYIALLSAWFYSFVSTFRIAWWIQKNRDCRDTIVVLKHISNCEPRTMWLNNTFCGTKKSSLLGQNLTMILFVCSNSFFDCGGQYYRVSMYVYDVVSYAVLIIHYNILIFKELTDAAILLYPSDLVKTHTIMRIKDTSFVTAQIHNRPLGMWPDEKEAINFVAFFYTSCNTQSGKKIRA